MKTYQDLMEVPNDDSHRLEFIKSVINEHKATDLYRNAVVADAYNRHLNTTINEYQKLLYTVTGKVIPDNYSANWKMSSGFFHRFITQEVQFLLGNGTTWNDSTTADKMGKDFDTRLQDLGKKALVGAVSFGFYNLDHIDVFSVLEFAPIYDEDNGALKAGVRFWQVATDKPLRATFYELDGYTDYIWRKGEGEVLQAKRAYKLKTRTTVADGTEIYDYENYPTFPIVPLWGNSNRQSELVGIREQIDCYDLIKSGFANDIDDASLIYWTIQNAGGMDDVDLAKFVNRMKTVHAVALEDTSAQAEAHTVDIPYASREALLDRLSKDLYRDAMALDTDNLAEGAVTATQIKAAYEPLNSKVDDFEYCVIDFINGILTVAGIENESPTFTRSIIVNKQEEVQTLIQSAPFLPSEYVTEKVLNLFGDGDKIDDILAMMDEQQMGMVEMGDDEELDESLGDDDEEDDMDAEFDSLLSELDEFEKEED